jgi:hypothetical protein
LVLEPNPAWEREELRRVVKGGYCEVELL